MQNTPNALRKQVAILGNTNAGKSTLFNALTGQDNAIVSTQHGTTTDPVQKAMELIPYGPIVLWDTAGLGDTSALGSKRMGKTNSLLRRIDAVLYLADATDFPAAAYREFCAKNTDHILVLGKCDLVSDEALAALHMRYPQAVTFSPGCALSPLRERLTLLLQAQETPDPTLLGDLLPAGSRVILVIPIDSEAPKGRLILPQVQLLRDCLDHDIQATVCRDTTLAATLADLGDVDLVVTDSQAFRQVDALVPPHIPLTSFSMLLARRSGRFQQLLRGTRAVDTLREGDRVLMLEGCTHNHTHQDIGRVKIPDALQRRAGATLHFDYHSGYDFPDDLSGYAMAVLCGSCMLGAREVTGRLDLLEASRVPASNYGILLAELGGILDRCRSFFSAHDPASPLQQAD